MTTILLINSDQRLGQPLPVTSTTTMSSTSDSSGGKGKTVLGLVQRNLLQLLNSLLRQQPLERLLVCHFNKSGLHQLHPLADSSQFDDLSGSIYDIEQLLPSTAVDFEWAMDQLKLLLSTAVDGHHSLNPTVTGGKTTNDSTAAACCASVISNGDIVDDKNTRFVLLDCYQPHSRAIGKLMADKLVLVLTLDWEPSSCLQLQLQLLEQCRGSRVMSLLPLLSSTANGGSDTGLFKDVVMDFLLNTESDDLYLDADAASRSTAWISFTGKRARIRAALRTQQEDFETALNQADTELVIAGFLPAKQVIDLPAAVCSLIIVEQASDEDSALLAVLNRALQATETCALLQMESVPDHPQRFLLRPCALVYGKDYLTLQRLF